MFVVRRGLCKVSLGVYVVRRVFTVSLGVYVIRLVFTVSLRVYVVRLKVFKVSGQARC